MLAFLEGLEAVGGEGLGALLASAPRVDAGRVFLVGDLLDLAPEALLALARRGRQLAALQLLAPCELAPEAEGAVEWWDPEAGERLRLEVDAARLARYHEALEARLEAWRRNAAAHRIRFTCRSSATSFEELVRELVGA